MLLERVTDGLGDLGGMFPVSLLRQATSEIQELLIGLERELGA